MSDAADRAVDRIAAGYSDYEGDLAPLLRVRTTSEGTAESRLREWTRQAPFGAGGKAWADLRYLVGRRDAERLCDAVRGLMRRQT